MSLHLPSKQIQERIEGRSTSTKMHKFKAYPFMDGFDNLGTWAWSYMQNWGVRRQEDLPTRLYSYHFFYRSIGVSKAVSHDRDWIWWINRPPSYPITKILQTDDLPQLLNWLAMSATQKIVFGIVWLLLIHG